MPEEDNNQQKPTRRKFIGVWFECCHAYGRLYKSKDGTIYRGRCPKCLRSVQVRVDVNAENATNRRFFRGR